MLQGVADNARSIGAHPIPVETEWTWGLIQVGHNTRYTEVLRKNGEEGSAISGTQLLLTLSAQEILYHGHPRQGCC